MRYILLQTNPPETVQPPAAEATADNQTTETVAVPSQPAAEPTDANQSPGFGGANILFFVAIFAIMYFLMIRPQQKKQKETQQMLKSLQENDKVITASGMIGRIISFKPDKDIVVIEIDDKNKIRVDFQRNAIAGIISPADNNRS